MNCLGSQCPVCNPFAIFQAVESLYSRPSKKEGAGKLKITKKSFFWSLSLRLLSGKGQRCGFLLEDGHSLITQSQYSRFDERILPAYPPITITTKTIIFCERVFEALNLCCGPKTLINIQQVVAERRFVNKE